MLVAYQPELVRKVRLFLEQQARSNFKVLKLLDDVGMVDQVHYCNHISASNQMTIGSRLLRPEPIE